MAERRAAVGRTTWRGCGRQVRRTRKKKRKERWENMELREMRTQAIFRRFSSRTKIATEPQKMKRSLSTVSVLFSVPLQVAAAFNRLLKEEEDPFCEVDRGRAKDEDARSQREIMSRGVVVITYVLLGWVQRVWQALFPLGSRPTARLKDNRQWIAAPRFATRTSAFFPLRR